MKKVDDFNEEVEILISERVKQIFMNLIKKDEIKNIKIEKEILEEDLEKFLKEKDNELFNKYCDYEEVFSEYISFLNKNYYKQGIKDGIKLVFECLK